MTTNETGPVSAEDGADMFAELGSGVDSGKRTTGTPQNTRTLPPNASYRNAALDTVSRGWTVFPLEFDTKDAPRVKWRDVNTTDPAQVKQWWRNGRYNIGIATGESDLYVVDVDTKPGKRGGQTWAALISEHGHTDTFTVRTATGGTHYYYRMPETRLRNSEGAKNGLGPDVDTRGDGGYVVGAGSVIRMDAYTVLHDLPVAELPEWISASMIEQGRGPRSTRPSEPGIFGGGVDGAAGEDETLERVRVLAQRIIDCPEGIGNTTLNEVGFKCGQYVGAGQVGFDAVAQILTDALSTWSFERNDEGKQYTQLLDALSDGAEIVDRPWGAGSTAAGLEDFDPDAVPDGVVTGLQLPDSFWEARPVLKHIRQAAWAHGTTADLVLMAILARLAAMVPHTTRFYSGIGTRGSMNLFVAVVGDSGIGKSSGAAVARTILHVPGYLNVDDAFRDGLPIGSGEGLAEAFMGESMVDTGEQKADGSPKMKKVRTVARHNVFAYVDEGQTLTAQAGRSGATIGPILRSAWVGELLGQSNASADNSRIVPSGAYSLGVLIGFQKMTAQPILSPEETANGTPQRFIWTTAVDPGFPEDQPDDPGPITLMNLGSVFGHEETIGVDPVIKAGLWNRNRKLKRGEIHVAPRDSHIQVMYLKLAGLLALLDDRSEITLDDWKLAGQIWQVSRAVQEDTVDHGQELRALEESRKTDVEISRQIRVSRALGNADTLIAAQASRMARCVHKNGVMAPGKVRSLGMKSPHRGLYDEALQYAITQRWLVEEGLKVAPGPVSPPPAG